ncbi:carboxypeptidase-like regulatory domain-containing protein, partial [Leeuwenhoekiella sp. UBA1003]|uniref:carboxypeptidase-like regulatory domain-containing protein n=1 Tax=Leeuwenhoekiella sp. UBA1003 TaxID=1946744 RepID=UPI0032E4119D
MALKTSIAPVASATLQQTITGTVTDSDGVLLPGASVMVQGTSIGTTTDFDGNFSIDASAGDVLEVSYVGFETQTITVSQQTNYNIQLAANTSELDE